MQPNLYKIVQRYVFWIIYPKIWVRKKFNFNNEEEKHSKFIRKTFEKCLNRIWKIFENPFMLLTYRPLQKLSKLLIRHPCKKAWHNCLFLYAAQYSCFCTLLLRHNCFLGVQNYIIWANKPRNPVDRYLTNAFYRHKNLTRIWQRVDKSWQEFDNGWQELTRIWQEFDNELTDIWQAPCKSLIICYLPNPYFLLKP